MRAFVKFDVSGIPSGATIHSASLELSPYLSNAYSREYGVSALRPELVITYSPP